ncbi:MAG: hypothetical protein J6Y32_08560 [Bacteroidales bacterium]|nr:hypothetical protein [Bacteroidales bacterium]
MISKGTNRLWGSFGVLAFSVAFVLFFSASTSPLYSSFEGFDSAVFKSVGLAILDGKVPYVDYFDHKGPVLYFINALGQWLVPGSTGVFLLQVLALSIAICFLLKIARLFVGGWKAYLVALLGMAVCFITYQWGNLCEEWELPAIAAALYGTLALLTGKWEAKRALAWCTALGALFTYSFFIRPNDAVSQMGGLMLAVFCAFLLEKEYLKAVKGALVFLGGAALAALPVLSYFAAHGALGDLWYGLIAHNLLYTGLSVPHSGIKRLWMLAFFALTLFLILRAGKRREALAMAFPFLFFGLLSGGQFFPHYLTALIPCLAAALALLASANWKPFVLYLLCLIAIVRYDFYNKDTLELHFHNEPYRQLYLQSQALLDQVPAEEKKQIWNYNLGFALDGFVYTSVFFRAGLVQANRIPLYIMGFVDPILAESDRIEDHAPLWVLLTHADDPYPYWMNPEGPLMKEYFQAGYDYIESQYDCVAKADTTVCSLELWKRRN